MVALYDEPIGDKHESIVLYFPGDVAGSTQRQVVPRKVGNQSIVFRTPGELKIFVEVHVANCAEV